MRTRLSPMITLLLLLVCSVYTQEVLTILGKVTTKR